MKKLILIFAFIITLPFINKANDLDQIRRDYITAIENSEKADKLCTQLEKIKNPSALEMAYLGSVQAIKAKHAWNPVNKMSYLGKGFEIINQAVAKDPNNLEVRFLRFSLQYYVPAFLGYSKNLITDKNKIVHIIKTTEPIKLNIEKKILQNMIVFMVDSKKCTEQELDILKKVLS
jgi:hypothetical protein